MRGGKFQFSTINTFGNTIGCSLAKENESKRKTRNTQKNDNQENKAKQQQKNSKFFTTKNKTKTNK